MRKDLRLGLGIGALALLFAVTFLLVRNHTENQAALEEASLPAQTLEGQLPPMANAPAGTGGAQNLPTIILPPLQPVPPPANVTPTPKARDPFERQPTGPAAPAAPTVSTDRSNWDVLLSEGRREPASSAAFSRSTPPSVSTDPVRSVTQVEPPTPRPTGSTQLSAATGRAYTIRNGDTFASVAKHTYGAEKYYLQIEQANPNVNTMRLRAGQQIILPELAPEARSSRSRTGSVDAEIDNRPIDSRTEYRVDTGDSLYRISMQVYGTPRMIDRIYEANRAAIGPDQDRLRLGMILKLPQPRENK